MLETIKKSANLLPPPPLSKIPKLISSLREIRHEKNEKKPSFKLGISVQEGSTKTLEKNGQPRPTQDRATKIEHGGIVCDGISQSENGAKDANQVVEIFKSVFEEKGYMNQSEFKAVIKEFKAEIKNYLYQENRNHLSTTVTFTMQFDNNSEPSLYTYSKGDSPIFVHSPDGNFNQESINSNPLFADIINIDKSQFNEKEIPQIQKLAKIIQQYTTDASIINSKNKNVSISSSVSNIIENYVSNNRLEQVLKGFLSITKNRIKIIQDSIPDKLNEIQSKLDEMEKNYLLNSTAINKLISQYNRLDKTQKLYKNVLENYNLSTFLMAYLDKFNTVTDSEYEKIIPIRNIESMLMVSDGISDNGASSQIKSILNQNNLDLESKNAKICELVNSNIKPDDFSSILIKFNKI